jgi:hypothetical protein
MTPRTVPHKRVARNSDSMKAWLAYAKCLRECVGSLALIFFQTKAISQVQTIRERYEYVLWVENLLNEHLTQIDTVLNLFNYARYQSFISAPHMYGATLRVRL